MAKKAARKPKGHAEFDALMRKLVRVPKAEVDRLEAERKKAKK